MNILKWLAIIIGCLIVIVIAALLGARFSDGPWGILPGGKLIAGERLPSPTDWDFAAEAEVVELQTSGRSRTTWIVIDQKQAYIPASTVFPPFKIWHKEALTAPVGIVRIQGKRYPIELQRVTEDSPLYHHLLMLFAKKYPGGAPGGPNSPPPWIFKLATIR